MLTPEQVLPFLQHPDLAIREHAVRYLIYSMDCGPASADDLWRSIDRFGVRASVMCLQFLSHLPQTQNSYTRLVAELGRVTDDREREMLESAFGDLSWELLSQNRDEVRAFKAIPAAMQKHHARRLTLDTWALDDLWRGLVQFAESGQVEDDVEETEDEWYDDLEGLRLIETMLRRFPQEASSRALDRVRSAAVAEKTDDDGMERFCIDILGRANERAAVPWLLKRLTSADDEMLTSPIAVALARLGDADLVSRLEAMYHDENGEVEWFTIIGILRGINIPETEGVLLRLLRSERDFDLRTSLAESLIQLCASPEALDEARIVAIQGMHDRRSVRLAGQILPAAAMVGFEAPEFVKWRRQLDEQNARGNAEAALLDRLLASPVSKVESIPWAGPSMPRSVTASQPNQRTAPKIGRNDACPCGSGKKYKKCCMNRTRTNDDTF
jgi:hypothetical protein